MKRGPNPKTFMVMAIGTFVLGLGASYFGYSQMSGVQGDVSALKSEVKDEKQVQQELDAAKAKLDECSVKLKHLEEGIPDTAYIPTLMQELEKTGNQYGIKVLGVRPIPKQSAPVKKTGDDAATAPTEKKSYDELAIEVKGVGSYGSAMRWVNSLEQFPKIIAARSVQLSPKAEPGKTESTLDITIELRAYVFPDSAKKSDLQNKSASLEGKHHEG